MALTWLVDTSVLTRLPNSEVRAAVTSLVEQGRVGRCTMSDLEIGFFARNGNEWDALQRALSAFPLVDVVSSDFDQARETQRALAALGLKGCKMPDLIIAAVALRMELSVLHYDRDFDLIAQITGQPTQWVTARGTVD
ncbi:PIN domain-containing protein [Actinophytocola sediminis]